jgi:hypothetical protein
MTYYFKKIAYLLTFIFSFSLYTHSNVNGQKKHIDLATIQWSQRSEVKEAVRELERSYMDLEKFVQEVYNAYAPDAIGEGKIKNCRVRDLGEFINQKSNIEGIYCQYKGSAAVKNFNEKEATYLKNAIRFYYFDQEMRFLLNMESNVIRRLESALETLSNPRLHPEFIKVTKYNEKKANLIIRRVEKAIHAAVATIPGGSEILKY